MELKPIITGFIAFTILVASLEVTQAGFKKGEAYYDAGKYTEAFKEFEPLAKEGDVRAQYLIGLMFVRGQGVPQDKNMTLKWWLKAAQKGHRSAQYNLGTMYHRGDGVPRDIDEAVKWYKRAAQQKHSIAQWRLGNHYQFSRSPDYQKANQWYQKAAEQGYALAQYQLGAMHLLKRWETSDVEAYMWLTLAKKGLISKDPFIKAARELNLQALDLLGQSMTSEKIDKAIADFRKAIAIDPNNRLAKTKLNKLTGIQKCDLTGHFHKDYPNQFYRTKWPPGYLKFLLDALDEISGDDSTKKSEEFSLSQRLAIYYDANWAVSSVSQLTTPGLVMMLAIAGCNKEATQAFSKITHAKKQSASNWSRYGLAANLLGNWTVSQNAFAKAKKLDDKYFGSRPLLKQVFESSKLSKTAFPN